MKRQMAKIIHRGIWRVIYDDSKKVNRYRVTKDGLKVVDYADMMSCLFHIGQAIEQEETK